MEREFVVVTMGDPAGIGPEIVAKSFAKKEINDLAKLVLVGDKDIMKKAIEITSSPVNINVIDELDQGNYEAGTINMFDLGNVDMEAFEYGKVSANCGQAAYDYIKFASDLCMEGKAIAMTTTTINKESLAAAGIKQLGHTDILEDLTGSDTPLTMFQTKELRIFFYSKHVSLREACDLINKDDLKTFIYEMNEALEHLGVKNPRIGVAGLNPHSGEHGLFGDEEVKYISPAIEEVKKESDVDVYGPIGADSVFFQTIRGKYDAVLSLYHDQGHIAAKTYDPDLTVSVTHKLPYLRTSVDHGTAFDIAGKGIASEISLDEAIRVCAQYAHLFRLNK